MRPDGLVAELLLVGLQAIADEAAALRAPLEELPHLFGGRALKTGFQGRIEGSVIPQKWGLTGFRAYGVCAIIPRISEVDPIRGTSEPVR